MRVQLTIDVAAHDFGYQAVVRAETKGPAQTGVPAGEAGGRLLYEATVQLQSPVPTEPQRVKHWDEADESPAVEMAKLAAQIPAAMRSAFGGWDDGPPVLAHAVQGAWVVVREALRREGVPGLGGSQPSLGVF